MSRIRGNNSNVKGTGGSAQGSAPAKGQPAAQPDDSEGKNDENKSRWQRASEWISRNRVTILTAIVSVAFFAGVGGLAVLLTTQTTRIGTLQALLFVALMGVFPVSYITYVGFGREEAHRERLKNDFRLLGLAREDNLDDVVSKLYRVIYNQWQYVAYISLIMLVSIFVFAGYLRQAELSKVLLNANVISQQTMELLFFTFLGAYVFAVQALVRRYNTLDLQPQVYSSVLVRILVAMAIVFAGVKLIEAAGGSLVEGQTEGGTPGLQGADAAAWATVLAFVIGAFPSVGFRWLVGLAGKILPLATPQASERPLTYLVGVSAWHEARLQEMGIDDAQNLATADIRKLLLTTRFDTQTIVNWIDQAILYTKIGPKMDRFRDAHIETFFQFKEQLHDIEVSQNDVEEKRQLLAVSLGLADSGTLDRLANSDNFPNYAHIVEYYSRIGDVAHEQAKEGMTNVLGVFRHDSVKSVEDAEKWLRRHPSDVEMWFALGKAYYQLDEIGEAERCYRTASEMTGDRGLQAEALANLSGLSIDRRNFEQAIAEATRAIERSSASKTAYNNRGFAYLLTGYHEEALADLDRALQLDDRYAVAYFNRGWVHLQEERANEATADFEKAHLLGYRDDPGIWRYWGEALFLLGKVRTAIEKFSESIRRADRLRTDHNETRLWAYARRGFAYLQEGAFAQAKMDLALVAEEASPDKPEHKEVLVTAHINLGMLHSARGRYDLSIENYEEAIKLDDRSIRAYYNLGVACHRIGDRERARNAFATVRKLAEPGSPEYRDADRWLALHAEEPVDLATESVERTDLNEDGEAEIVRDEQKIQEADSQ